MVPEMAQLVNDDILGKERVEAYKIIAYCNSAFRCTAPPPLFHLPYRKSGGGEIVFTVFIKSLMELFCQDRLCGCSVPVLKHGFYYSGIMLSQETNLNGMIRSPDIISFGWYDS